MSRIPAVIRSLLQPRSLVDILAGSARDSKGQRGQRRGGAARSAGLTGKPTRTYVAEFPQITEAEGTDEDDGVEYGFRWQGGDF